MSAEDSVLVRCPSCGENAAPRARFCENCGTALGTGGADPSLPSEVTLDVAPTVLDLDPATGEAGGNRRCAACGGVIADDGYCADCGTPGQSERDHFEERPATWVAGVCDRGIRHARNEDAMALAANGAFAALVVCDGVSSAPDSDVASLAASRAARDVLVAYGPEGPSSVEGATSRRIAGWTDAMVAASRAAGQAVRGAAEQLAATKGTDVADDPPSCTFVAAVVDHDLIVAGWLGDSRVYWLPDAGPAEQLSVDDSWAQEMIAAGVPRAQAETSPQAHAITRWLGPDAADTDARCAATVPNGPGWLLVCSDGLWNYCSDAHEMGELVRKFAGCGEPHAAAAALVRWANAQGGRDNITAALARIAPTVTEQR
ncbi:PP2C family serine/threonine-protein phosphatase [Promicromonospora sukumoe]|uniref:PP2C family serine/threonine-protein phosphatase n=1 Tax=Promicromonospora sukumoe TaxID=88382 RepID=UPI00035F7CDC|nr:PP2C family serine/threonine-protein phosphatase [Promicromonospora sukumoe]